ncbi:hypothetical protein IAQ61_010608 [Plenodomus lingam]|uniref:uncharacterized protein n=1 Tax=Leptosphaeria maculans TaxID=5022 RepID=UPI003318422B|nr:hypothetical protein IAQ61_010608 [Plenodomus lingam]
MSLFGAMVARLESAASVQNKHGGVVAPDLRKRKRCSLIGLRKVQVFIGRYLACVSQTAEYLVASPCLQELVSMSARGGTFGGTRPQTQR